jgi:uncharacterized cysteine cluster protein YcgN (CxxCxxCC family)
VTKAFWQDKSLSAMSVAEWESICDGCGKCCLQQLEDEDTEQLLFTDVACDLFVDGSCQCSDYNNRSERVPTCISMNKENVDQCAEFAPPSCAYRLLLEGESLPSWHHLRSGSRDTIHDLGYSVSGRIRYRRDVEDDNLVAYVVDWPMTT